MIGADSYSLSFEHSNDRNVLPLCAAKDHQRQLDGYPSSSPFRQLRRTTEITDDELKDEVAKASSKGGGVLLRWSI